MGIMRNIADFYENEENSIIKGEGKNSERPCKGLISLKKDRSRPEPLRIFHHDWLLSSITTRRVALEYVSTRRNFNLPAPQALVLLFGVIKDQILWFTDVKK